MKIERRNWLAGSSFFDSSFSCVIHEMSNDLIIFVFCIKGCPLVFNTDY